MTYVVGIDGGTESIRAHVFALDGNCLASVAAPYATQFPAPGHAEQDPEGWWEALGKAVRGAVAQSGVDRHRIASLCVATTSCTMVVLDAAGNPLAPALLWMDVRAGREAEQTRAARDACADPRRNNHGPVSAEWMIPKALWLKTHLPELYARASRICEYQDFLNLRLTGRWLASLNNISVRWHYQSDGPGWPDDILAALDLLELRDKWPREIAAMGAAVGELGASAALHLDLPRTVKVIQGGCDAFVGMVGTGVHEPERISLISGSSHLQLAVSETALHVPGLWGSHSDAVYEGRHIIEGGQSATGSMVAWLSRTLAENGDLRALNAAAEAIEIGSDGLFVLDHFQGRRTPFPDADARGAFVGLSLSHTPAHLFRASIEGICFGTRTVLETMREHGLFARDMTVCGGATRSALWLKIHADTSGLPIRVPRNTDGPGLGAAILAARGAGLFASMEEAISAMVAMRSTIEPDPGRVARYDELYEASSALYPLFRDWRDTHNRPAA